MFDNVDPNHPLVGREKEDIGNPEENIEQGHVHVVVETIVDQSSVSVFQEDRPTERETCTGWGVPKKRRFRI